MMELSSNWKKLSHKISKKSSKKNKDNKKVKAKSLLEKSITKPISTKIDNIRNDDTSSFNQHKKSQIELALWLNNYDIITKDLNTLSSMKSSNDARKIEPGKFLAMDCEFVGVGPDGEESALARVSVVNFYGHVLIDKFVKPKEKVTDWRTWVSGVTPKHMKDAISFSEAQTEVANLLNNRILVGHAIHHDLQALYLSHPKSKIRDTSKYKPFREISKGKTPSLKKLSLHFIGMEIQSGEHSSVEDARATMLLYRLHKSNFENSMRINN